MSAYDPALSETDAIAGPPKYENDAKMALTVFSWLGLIGGPLVILVALAVAKDDDYATAGSVVANSGALLVGVVVFVLGAVAFFVQLAARSVTYDLMYRFGPRPDYRPADSTEPSPTVDNTEHFTPEATR